MIKFFRSIYYKFYYKFIFFKNDIDYIIYNHFTKRLNAIKFALRNKDKYCPWDVYESSIAILFSQFTDYYENNKEDFSDKRIEELFKELESYKEQKWNKEHITAFKKQIEKDKKCFREIKRIYIYIKESRQKNLDKAEEILEKMFPDSRRWDPSKGTFGTIKNLKVVWTFDENGLADVTYTDVDTYNLSFDNFEEALVKKDIEIAKKILDIKSYLVN